VGYAIRTEAMVGGLTPLLHLMPIKRDNFSDMTMNHRACIKAPICDETKLNLTIQNTREKFIFWNYAGCSFFNNIGFGGELELDQEGKWYPRLMEMSCGEPSTSIHISTG
jgi:hypothetical protein